MKNKYRLKINKEYDYLLDPLDPLQSFIGRWLLIINYRYHKSHHTALVSNLSYQ